MSKVVRDAERRLHNAQMRLSGASEEQLEECRLAVAQAKKLVEVAHRRAEADKIIAKEKS
jgi:hypothetical protein